MRRATLRLAVSLSVLAALAACGPSDPLNQTVSASTSGRLAIWRAHFASGASVEMRRRADAAFEEIRNSAAGERDLSRRRGEPIAVGSDAIDETVRERVDGRPLREVLQLGLELRLPRLKAELAVLEDSVEKNTQLITKPGDTASRRHLDELRDRQLARIAKYREDIATVQGELEPLMGKSGRSVLPAKSAEGDAVPQLLR